MPCEPPVIVVDDEPPIVDLVCDVLKDEGIPAQACPCGKHAFTCILQCQPRLVVLDVQMPEVDGIQLFEMIRADPMTSHVPVLFFTANAHIVRQRVPDYKWRGAQLVLKPFDVDAFLSSIQQALDGGT